MRSINLLNKQHSLHGRDAYYTPGTHDSREFMGELWRIIKNDRRSGKWGKPVHEKWVLVKEGKKRKYGPAGVGESLFLVVTASYRVECDQREMERWRQTMSEHFDAEDSRARP